MGHELAMVAIKERSQGRHNVLAVNLFLLKVLWRVVDGQVSAWYGLRSSVSIFSLCTFFCGPLNSLPNMPKPGVGTNASPHVPLSHTPGSRVGHIYLGCPLKVIENQVTLELLDNYE